MRDIHISAVIGSEMKVEEQIPLMRQAGFKGFFAIYEGTEPIELWAETVRRQGMVFETVHGPFRFANRMWEEGESGDSYLEYLKSTVDTCGKIHVGKYILHVTVGSQAPPVSSLGLERFASLCGYAKERGVSICFENLEPLPHLEAVMDHIQDPFHGFCWDIGHNACYSPHIDMAKKYGQRLKCLHIHDNRGITRPGDIDYRDDLHLLPFDGILDWEWFAGQLRACSYEGPITLEVSCLHGNNYQAMTMPQYLAQAYQRGEKLRTLVDG